MSKSEAVSGPTSKPTAGQIFWRELRGYAEALVIAFLVVTFVFNTVAVIGSSMRPNLYGGDVNPSNPLELLSTIFTVDRVFIPKYDTWLRRIGILGDFPRGDVVVVREPTNAPSAQMRERRPFFIKRLIAKEGDRIYVDEGKVFVNGFELDQSFIDGSGEITPDAVSFPVIVVREGEVVGFQVPGPRSTPISVANAQVERFYGGVLAALAPLPDGIPEGEPFLHEMIVPDGQYFVMGDNRQRSKGGSEDSLMFGPVEGISIAGRATAVIWPPRRDGAWNWRLLGPPETFKQIPDPQAR